MEKYSEEINNQFAAKCKEDQLLPLRLSHTTIQSIFKN